MMREILATLRVLVILLIVALAGYYLGYIRIPWFEKSLTDLEADCVVAAIHSDARWSTDNVLAVRRGVGRAVLEHARVYKRDVCDVFRQGLTLVPPGYQRFGNVYFRSVTYVRNSLEATEDSWKSDIQLVKELQKEKGAGCATHYLRKARMSDWVAQSPKARNALRTSPKLRSAGKAKNDEGKEVGEAEFFCPRL